MPPLRHESLRPVATARPALRRTLAASLLVVALAAWVAAQTAAPPAAQPLTLDQIFAPDPGGRLPSRLAWAPDGRRLAYVWEQEGESWLWLLAAESGKTERLLRTDQLGPDGLELAGYQWAPGGDGLLIEAGGDLFLHSLDGGTLRRLTDSPEEREEKPAFSPDGSRVAFIRDFDLHLLDLASGEVRELTTGGSRNEILNGITDWVYWEEIWGRDSTGFWWSPAGDAIAYYQFDERSVPTYPLVDFTSRYPTVEWQKYPKAGQANPLVRVGVLELASGETTWLDTAGEEETYLARVAWQPGGERLAVQRLTREQNRLDLLTCAAARGECSTLLTEEWPTWINLHDDLRFLADGRFVWRSEKSGWSRLYLYAADGRELRQLSPPRWSVTALDALAEDAGVVLYTAHAIGDLGALYRRVLASELAGDESRPLTDGAAWSSATAAASGGLWVHRTEADRRPRRLVVRDLEGTELAALPHAAAGVDVESLPRWRYLTLPGPDGSLLPAALLTPDEPDCESRHPAIMYHYGGPGSQVVSDRWSSRGRALWHKMMAQRGYYVLKVDNLGSTHFGKRGEDRLHRRFGEVNLAAQRAGVEYLANETCVDRERIGLWGWSGGGANTLYALSNSPGTWRAAVAGAPVTDWHLYDTIWTERYLDHPDDNPDGYRDSSAVTHAGQLADALLIVHGTADDNVHPQNTLVMSRALIDAGVPFEQAIHPRQKHGFRGADARHFYARMTEFFDRHLGAAADE